MSDGMVDREVEGHRFRVTRDAHGIVHVSAGAETDGWCGLGWAAAEDRLWQMEFDRRRAAGTWAAVVGPSGLAADRLARRLRLVDAARADLSVMDDATAASFEAYAAGVNGFVAAHGLPPEHDVAGLGWEPWTPADSVAAFKVRHVVMGVWQYKLARATLLAGSGPGAFDALDPQPLAGMRVTVPADARLPDGLRASLLSEARADVEAAASHLGFLSEVEAGSNAWVVGPGRTATGAPLLANDSHRALDAPNVYWQAHLTCDAFSVSGGTFPGLPGFPHFGHNGRVGWAITNAAGDAQDLYVEQFRGSGEDGDPTELRTHDGWVPAPRRAERIDVRGEEEVVEWCWETPNGPIVHGDPASGQALSLRWAAADEPCAQFGVLVAMAEARTAAELLAVQEPWVDPINNLLVADVDGHIGYLLRGSLPARRRTAAAQLPVPGWDPAHGWDGRVPPARMPRSFDPPEQLIVSANNTVSADPDPLVSHAVNDSYRVERIHELATGAGHTLEDLQAWQGDTVSVAARRWADLLDRRGPFDGPAEEARRAVVAAAGDLRADAPGALVHACLRRELLLVALDLRVGPEVRQQLLASALPGTPVLLRRWFAQLTWPPRPGADLPAASLPDDLIERCLARAWQRAEEAEGPWGEVHRTAARHPLHPLVGDRLDPPSVGVGGDGETVQNAAYAWPVGSPFAIVNLSVYRQVLDLGDLSRSRWIVPGGASGVPDHPHASDQLGPWSRHELWPMHP